MCVFAQGILISKENDLFNRKITHNATLNRVKLTLYIFVRYSAYKTENRWVKIVILQVTNSNTGAR